MTFENTTDEELKTLYINFANQMMYYQCAEGESYWREAAARGNCKAELALFRKELYARGLEVPTMSHLV